MALPVSPQQVTGLIARAPTRLDFGGGWTDVPPYSEEEGGFVCNVAIARYATVRVRPTESEQGSVIDTRRAADSALAEAAVRRSGVQGITVEITSDFPLGAGLGGSSAAGVAVNGALSVWQGRSLDRATLAEQSRAIEVEDLGVPGGRQDHYAAAYGGALALTFSEETRVRRLPVLPECKAALERRCIVVYTGQSRISGDTITAVLGAYRDRNRHVLHALGRMKALARAMADELCEHDIDELGDLVWEHWQHQRSLHPSIPTPLIDSILDRARTAGARGGKALGASGGGCVLIIAGDDNVDHVTSAVTELAPHIVPFQIDELGLTCKRITEGDQSSMAQLTHEQYDLLERAITEKRRIAVMRRGTEYVVVPSRLSVENGREAIQARHPSGTIITFYIDEVQSVEVVK